MDWKSPPRANDSDDLMNCAYTKNPPLKPKREAFGGLPGAAPEHFHAPPCQIPSSLRTQAPSLCYLFVWLLITSNLVSELVN